MRTNPLNLTLILTAAGSSTRMGGGIKKEYMKLGNGTVLSTAARAFLSSAAFSTIIVTTPANGTEAARNALFSDPEIQDLLSRNNTTLIFTEGSSTRQASVRNALLQLESHLIQKGISAENTITLIHDAARPFVDSETINSVIIGSQEYGACVPVIPAVDTQKELDETGRIKTHLIRKNLGAVQTPQGFYLEPLILCHNQATLNSPEYTDDSEIWDAFPQFTQGRRVMTVKGSVENKKITYPSDLEDSKKHMIRIGLGTDLHRLEEGRKFYLGGVEIPAEKGEVAHSDGDVLLHAITDALLGAAGLGDIGTYFPPEDDQWKDADSRQLLAKCWSDVQAQGWSLGNLDCVLEFEKPKFIPWRASVISSIAGILGVQENQVFVKAKTNEKLDSIGEGKAIKAYCTCLLEK